MYTIWTPGVFSSRVRKTPHLLKGKYRYNLNSGATRVYQLQNSFTTPIPLHLFYENITAGTFIYISNHKGEDSILPFIRVPPLHLEQSGRFVVTSFHEYIWGRHYG